MNDDAHVIEIDRVLVSGVGWYRLHASLVASLGRALDNAGVRASTGSLTSARVVEEATRTIVAAVAGAQVAGNAAGNELHVA